MNSMQGAKSSGKRSCGSKAPMGTSPPSKRQMNEQINMEMETDQPQDAFIEEKLPNLKPLKEEKPPNEEQPTAVSFEVPSLRKLSSSTALQPYTQNRFLGFGINMDSAFFTMNKRNDEIANSPSDLGQKDAVLAFSILGNFEPISKVNTSAP